ncbi:MAG: NADH:ubiquinone oxidoreductase subunit [Alphaproteobacteria bacterium]|nr:NADH:ubiquinone oxidoreductase subunit [Alphaproteobacteria bacterium]
MIIADILFYVFATILLLSAMVVIGARNAVHSVLFLILAFFNAAGIFVLLGAEYVAMLLVIVYVGAVAVLFLFVVMMLDIAAVKRVDLRRKHLMAGTVVGAALLAELVLVFKSWTSAEGARDNALFQAMDGQSIGSAQALGNILYTNYLYPFQVSGLILLVAMIGAITLTLRLRSGIRRQNNNAQVTRRPSESMGIIHVESGKGVEL